MNLTERILSLFDKEFGHVWPLWNSLVKKATGAEITPNAAPELAIRSFISTIPTLVIEEGVKVLNGRKLEQTKNESDNDWFFGSGYNQGTDDAIKALQEMVGTKV